MTLRVFVGAAIGAVVLFVWGFLWWGLLPFSKQTIKPLPTEVVTAIDRSLSEDGTYLFPPPPMEAKDDAERSRVEERWVAGPVGTVYFLKGGVDPHGASMLIGFLIGFVACYVAAGALSMGVAAMPAMRTRWLFVFRLGLFIAIGAYVSDMVWWHRPAAYTLACVVYHVVGWSLVGLAVAAVVKPRPAVAA